MHHMETSHHIEGIFLWLWDRRRPWERDKVDKEAAQCAAPEELPVMGETFLRGKVPAAHTLPSPALFVGIFYGSRVFVPSQCSRSASFARK